MADFNILVQDVPVGNTAVANIQVTSTGEAEDVDSVRAVWKDHTAATISDETWTGSDISTTGIHGEAVTLTDPTGTGNYKATLVIDSGAYTSGSFPKGFLLEVTITDTALGSRTETFNFDVVATSLDVTLDPLAISTNVKRLAGLLVDKSFVLTADSTADATLKNVSLGNEIVFEIDQVTKNGTELTQGTDYSWNTHRPYIVLTDDVVAGDHIYVRCLVGYSSEYINREIENLERIMRSQLAPFYTAGDLASSQTFVSMVQDVAIGRLLKQRTKGIALESATYRSAVERMETAEELLKDIRMGRANLLAATLDDVERKDGSLVGGATLQSSADRRTREELLDDIQEYDRSVPNFLEVVLV